MYVVDGPKIIFLSHNNCVVASLILKYGIGSVFFLLSINNNLFFNTILEEPQGYFVII